MLIEGILIFDINQSFTYRSSTVWYWGWGFTMLSGSIHTLSGSECTVKMPRKEEEKKKNDNNDTPLLAHI